MFNRSIFNLHYKERRKKRNISLRVKLSFVLNNLIESPIKYINKVI